MIDEDDPTHGSTRAIHEPLGLDTPVSVSFEEDGETWVVGTGAREPRTFAGFYNRGLTLFETQAFDEAFDGLHFKIDSPRLAHTLSRDNVRRDAELRRAVRRVRELAEGALWDALVTRARSDAAAGDAGSLSLLLEAAATRMYRKKKRTESLEVPLTDAIEGRTSVAIRQAIRDGVILFSEERTPLTRELASAGYPVVRHAELGAYVALHAGDVVHAAHEMFGVCDATGVLLAKSDEELAREVVQLLHAAERALARVRFASFGGLGRDDRCRVVETERDATVVAKPTERKWSRTSTVFLNVDDPLVQAARKRAESNVALAAHVVARAVLLDEGPVGRSEVERLLAAVRP